jgi:outer membrane murein-binding lipoprotein Lpp
MTAARHIWDSIIAQVEAEHGKQIWRTDYGHALRQRVTQRLAEFISENTRLRQLGEDVLKLAAQFDAIANAIDNGDIAAAKTAVARAKAETQPCPT